VPDQDDVVQVQVLDQPGQVIGVGAQVVAPTAATSDHSPPVVGDGPVSGVGDELGLRIPRIRGQRPAVAGDDGLPAAPVLVADVHAIPGGVDPMPAPGAGGVHEAHRVVRPVGRTYARTAPLASAE
jgi:hypothetical protein